MAKSKTADLRNKHHRTFCEIGCELCAPIFTTRGQGSYLNCIATKRNDHFHCCIKNWPLDAGAYIRLFRCNDCVKNKVTKWLVNAKGPELVAYNGLAVELFITSYCIWRVINDEDDDYLVTSSGEFKATKLFENSRLFNKLKRSMGYTDTELPAFGAGEKVNASDFMTILDEIWESKSKIFLNDVDFVRYITYRGSCFIPFSEKQVLFDDTWEDESEDELSIKVYDDSQAPLSVPEIDDSELVEITDTMLEEAQVTEFMTLDIFGDLSVSVDESLNKTTNRRLNFDNSEEIEGRIENLKKFNEHGGYENEGDLLLEALSENALWNPVEVQRFDSKSREINKRCEYLALACDDLSRQHENYIQRKRANVVYEIGPRSIRTKKKIQIANERVVIIAAMKSRVIIKKQLTLDEVAKARNKMLELDIHTLTRATEKIAMLFCDNERVLDACVKTIIRNTGDVFKTIVGDSEMIEHGEITRTTSESGLVIAKFVSNFADNYFHKLPNIWRKTITMLHHEDRRFVELSKILMHDDINAVTKFQRAVDLVDSEGRHFRSTAPSFSAYTLEESHALSISGNNVMQMSPINDSLDMSPVLTSTFKQNVSRDATKKRRLELASVSKIKHSRSRRSTPNTLSESQASSTKNNGEIQKEKNPEPTSKMIALVKKLQFFKLKPN